MILNLKATKRKENSSASSKIMLIDTWQSMTPCDFRAYFTSLGWKLSTSCSHLLDLRVLGGSCLLLILSFLVSTVFQ